MWLTSDATSFSASCERCRGELSRSDDGWSVGLRATRIDGSLRAEADVGFMTCRRGHRIVVRRALSWPLAATR